MVYAQVHRLFPSLTTIADYNIPNAEFDLIDEHYYNSPSWFFGNFNFYDNYDRKQKPVYVGEVAVTTPEGGPDKGNMLAALSEGVFLMGCENNADVVKMVSYAPLLAHVNGKSGWHGMILFDSLRTAGTVSYHLWKLFHTNRPDVTIPTAVKSASTGRKVIDGKIGVGTWLTSSEYKDITVTAGGKTLYDSNANGFPGAKTEGGIWQTFGNVAKQVGKETGTYTFGDASWSEYTLKLKARKLSGDEGFLIVFGDKTGQRYWWNMGGWGNREHGIERNRAPVGQRVPGRIETGRWYDIEVNVSGGLIVCKLDGKQIHSVPVPDNADVYASSGYDAAKKEIIVKLVNSTNAPKGFGVSMSGLSGISNKATMTIIRADDPQANNSLLEPNKVVPAVSTIAWPPATGKVTLGSNALAIIRFKANQTK
jgi:alpha-L-arabinofuranosidase